ncbi:hypothetical protein Lalb_Chr25g0283781 [Lupinus albus]|uniref:Uncharacterized protein n=1 Tax=Lupinus albus TaxID=3870 RepID=A0A6A4N329_LUPAL|nr:hypothetical protein Lalb_Chr25g0283781 [Lupinus albus]
MGVIFNGNVLICVWCKAHEKIVDHLFFLATSLIVFDNIFISGWILSWFYSQMVRSIFCNTSSQLKVGS